MRLSWKWLLGAAVVAVIIVVGVGLLVVQPPRPLIAAAAIEPAVISPNADGVDDITRISYELTRAADVTITFEREDGRAFVFRQDEPRTAGEYSVLFSGVVDGFVEPDETVSGDVLRRLMPDGVYRWTLTAAGESETQTVTGTITLQDGEAALPDIVELTVFPEVFTPNQDGVSDRSAINVGLSQDATLDVFLQQEGGEPIFLPERLETLAADAPSLRRYFDYEGGVDLGADPPADGTYTVVARTQDAVGQQVQRTASLTIQNGGRPLAQIVPQPSGATVVFDVQPYRDAYLTTAEARGELISPPDDPQALSTNAISMAVGDLLVFKLTVENYGDVPIRTAGSPPGTVYDWSQRASTLGEFDESGAWRVGIDCDTAGSVYPWRWRVGTDAELVEQVDPATGETFLYLPAHARVVVWGAVRMSEVEARNPQNCWAGLIHEDVAISQLNDYVGPRRIFLETDASQP
jgi:hypothetical protein